MLDVKPGETLDLAYEVPKSRTTNDEYIITFTVRERYKTLYADKGHKIVSHQVVLCPNTVTVDVFENNKEVRLEQKEEKIVLITDKVEIAISKKTGLVCEYKVNNENILKEETIPYFWRASTNNDRGFENEKYAITWRNPQKSLVNLRVSKHTSLVIVEVDLVLDNKTTIKYVYTLDGNSKLKIEQITNPNRELEKLPVISDMMILDDKYKNITYYGRGPIENYWDKYKCADIGIYKDEVTNKMVNYLQPQENGAKTDIRFLEVTDENGVGIKIKGLPTFEFNISKYHPEDVEKADHFYKLTPYDGVVLRVIYKQMGVGGDDSWHALPHAEYRLNSNMIYTNTYTIEPII